MATYFNVSSERRDCSSLNWGWYVQVGLAKPILPGLLCDGAFELGAEPGTVRPPGIGQSSANLEGLPTMHFFSCTGAVTLLFLSKAFGLNNSC